MPSARLVGGMEEYLPPAAQEKFAEIEELQAEAEDVVSRREDAEEALEDAQDALDALDAVPEGEAVYRQVGTVRVRTDPATAEESLRASVSTLERRIEELEETESDLREEFERRKEDVRHLLGGPSGGPGTGD